jgi:hypothetical protein
MKQRSKHALSAIELVFSAWSMPKSYLEDNWCCSAVEVSVVEWATEAVKSPLIRFVTGKSLVETLQKNNHC